MSALVTTTDTRKASALADQQREIRARIDRGGVHICEADLRRQLRWNNEHGELLDVVAELESRGLIQSALHFGLADQGRAELPASHQPPLRVGSGGIPWTVRR